MNRPLRVGLVGAGMVSQYHVAGWLDCPDAQLVAIADSDLEKARTRAALVPGAREFGSLAAMIADCDLDAVDIVTPPASHAALIAEAQAAGLHVICQKPLAPTATDVAALVQCQSPHLRAMVHENWRWRHPYRALKAALDTGDVARPDRFEFRVESAGLMRDQAGQYPALERQPFFAVMDRLIVFELLVHHLDTLTFVFGDIEIRAAELLQRCDAVRGEDGAVIDLVAGGIPGRLIGDFCVTNAPPMPRDRLFFNDHPAPIVDGWSLHQLGEETLRWDRAQGYQDSYSHTISHFRGSLSSGQRFETEFDDALVLQRLVDRIYSLGKLRQA